MKSLKIDIDQKLLDKFTWFNERNIWLLIVFVATSVAFRDGFRLDKLLFLILFLGIIATIKGLLNKIFK